MKQLWLLVLLLADVAAQNVATQKPCIAFSPESSSATNLAAKDALEAAVKLSGDFVFYASNHDGCWNVHVLSLRVTSAKGKHLGYAISHTVTDLHGVEVGHALTFGPDQDIFVRAMRKAAADAIRNIRIARSVSQSGTIRPFASRTMECLIYGLTSGTCEASCSSIIMPTRRSI